jgi:hypothetical protein
MQAELAASLPFDPLTLAPPPMPQRKRYLDWAELLRRKAFGRDVLICERCGGRR